MARVVGMQRAMQLVLTGEPITARTAYEWGFVNEVVAPRVSFYGGFQHRKNLQLCLESL